MFSVPTESPTDWMEVILLPGILLFFGLLVYLLGEFNIGDGGKPRKWRWAGVGLIFLAGLLGFRYLLAMVGNTVEAFAYRELVRVYGRKMVAAHWFVGVTPALCILLSFLTSRIHGKRLAQSHEDL